MAHNEKALAQYFLPMKNNRLKNIALMQCYKHPLGLGLKN
jgi:hypothetical protein